MLISDLVQRYKADTLLLPHGLPSAHPVAPLPLVVRNKQLVLLQSFRVKNAFLVTKSGDKIAKYFGISKYTLYSYIDKQQEEK